MLIDGPTASGEFLDEVGPVAVRDGRLDLNVGGTAGLTMLNLVELDLDNSGSITFRSTGGDIIFEDPNDTIRTEGGSIIFEAYGDMTLGGLDTRGAMMNQSGSISISSIIVSDSVR